MRDFQDDRGGTINTERKRTITEIAIMVALCALLIAGAIGVTVMLLGRNKVNVQPHVAGGPEKAAQVPTVAPPGNPAKLENGIVQRSDGTVFIHSGEGSVTLFPRGKRFDFAFGYRPVADGKVDQRRWRALIDLMQDKPLQQKVGVTEDQLKQIRSKGKVPIPAESKAEVESLCALYLLPSDADEEGKKKVLDAVRRAGEAQEPLVVEWLSARWSVLSEDQHQKLLELTK